MSLEIEEQKWNFKVSDEDVPERSGEDPSFDHFPSGLKNRYIIREYTQNSLDAPSELGNRPVIVSISQDYIDSDSYPNFFNLLDIHIRACQASCNENKNSQNPYDVKVDYLNSHLPGLIPMTIISDRNTTGMPWVVGGQSKFKAGVRLMAASYKPGDGKQGGSHGLGKTIGYVASSLNTTYTSTMTEPNDLGNTETFGEGVTRLSVHNIEHQETGEICEYHSDAFYDSHKGKSPDSGDEIPPVFRRNEPGTSVYIIANELSEKDVRQMREEALRSFCLAIKDGDLTLDIMGEEFSEGNLQSKMDIYFPETDCKYDRASKYDIVEKFYPRIYFQECMIGHDNDESHFTFEATADKYPNIGHAVLSIYKDEEIKNHHEDRILCMRDKKMVIEMKTPGTKKGYVGVFVCDGDGSKMLRKMENVTHDKWTTKEVKNLNREMKAKAKAILEEINKFIDDCVASIFPIDDTAKFSVPVLSQLIAAKGTRKRTDSNESHHSTDSSNETGSSAVSTIAASFTDKRVEAQKRGKLVIKKKGGTKKKGNQEEDSGSNTETTIPVPIPAPSPDVPPTVDPKPGPSPKPDPKPEPTPPGPIVPTGPEPDPAPIDQPMENTDTQDLPLDSPKPKAKRRKKGNHAEIIVPEPRVIPIVEDSGIIHRIIIDSDDNYTSCSMVVSIAGEDRDSALSFSSVDPNYHISGKDSNIISDFNLHKGKNYIDIRFEDNDIHSLIIKAYED